MPRSRRTSKTHARLLSKAATILLCLLPIACQGADERNPSGSQEMTESFIDVLDPSFAEIVPPNPERREIAAKMVFTEGPVWMPNLNALLYSDIPADTMYIWREGATPEVWRKPSHNANGNTVDLEGRLVTCEHGSRQVTRTDAEGNIEVLAAAYQGKKLNSPNDAVVKSDGTIWFTDPPYGIKPDQKEQPKHYVFRLDPGAAEPVVVAEDFVMPTGLCFSPDESLLYIADSGRPHHVRRFRVTPDNMLKGGEVFVVLEPGVPDGMRVDRAGRLFSTAGDGVQVFNTDGKLIGRIKTPESAANCTFGGENYDTLFITARTSVWAVKLNTQGIR